MVRGTFASLLSGCVARSPEAVQEGGGRGLWITGKRAGSRDAHPRNVRAWGGDGQHQSSVSSCELVSDANMLGKAGSSTPCMKTDQGGKCEVDGFMFASCGYR